MDKIKLTVRQNAIVRYIAQRLLEAQQDVQRWKAEQQRSIQEFAIDLGVDLRENWQYNDGQFTKMGSESKQGGEVKE